VSTCGAAAQALDSTAATAYSTGLGDMGPPGVPLQHIVHREVAGVACSSEKETSCLKLGLVVGCTDNDLVYCRLLTHSQKLNESTYES
jgi:hypothetical protein